MNRLFRPITLVVFVVVVMATSGILYVFLGDSRSGLSAADEQCRDLLVTDPAPISSTRPRSVPEPQPPPGWEYMTVKPGFDPATMWKYVNDFFKAPDGERIEVVEQPGISADVVMTDRSHPVGGPGYRTRQVIVSDKAWIEDAALQQRVECERPPTKVPADMMVNRPLRGWGMDDARLSDFPNPFEFPPRIARRIGERSQEGETLLLYEMMPSEGLPHLRGVFAIDGGGYLRFHEVTDTRTGEVVLHRQADPVPGHPPIADPTGQPIISPE